MNGDTPNPALLPAGLMDLLPPEAEREAALVEAMMATFAGHGYERLKPPLLEFEDSLLAGSGAAVAEQTFRLMDPVSQRMMGLRADTTPQVARIAATRLAQRPAAAALLFRPGAAGARHPARPGTAIAQAGIELIGSESPAADAEVALVAAEALARVGLPGVSLDITLPTMAPALLEAAGVAGAAPAAWPGRWTARMPPPSRRAGRAAGRRAARAAAGGGGGRWGAGGAGRHRACRRRRGPSPTMPPR